MSLELTTGKRKIKNGSHYNQYFPTQDEAYSFGKNGSIVLNTSGDVYETVKYIAQIIDADAADTAQIAQLLVGESRQQTVANIHKFMIDYLQYDTETAEKLRSPRRTWWVGTTQNDKETGDNGVDCDDLAIFSGTILKNLGIPFFIKIVKIASNDFSHVYLVVPQAGEQLSGTYITLDGVLSKFNYEYPYTQAKTYNMDGTNISYLGGFKGLGSGDPVLNMLLSQKQVLQTLQPTKINKDEALQMLDHLIDNWENEQTRKEALSHIASLEKQYFPNMSYFQTLSYFVENEKLPALAGLGELNPEDDPCSDYYQPYYADDPEWHDDPYNWQQPDYCSSGGSNDGGSGSSDGGSGIDWGSIFDSLARFDWGIFFPNNNNTNDNPTYPTTNPDTTNAGFQIAGMSVATLAGLGLAGALVWMVYANMQGAKTGQHPMIKQTNQTKKPA